jgi:DnaK suppressor protein
MATKKTPAKSKAKAKTKAKAKAKTKVKAKAKTAPKAKAKTVAKAKAKTKAAPKAKAKAKTKAAPKAKAKTAAKAKTTAQRVPKAKVKTQAKAKPKAQPRPKATAKPKAAPKATKANVSKPKAKPKAKAAARPVAPAAVTAPDSHMQARGFTPYKIKRGEEYMNEAQKEHFKNILRSWRNELMQEVDRTVHHMQDEAANPPDPADRATLEEEFSIELRTRDRERRLIKKIDSTIELIANDDYGWCDSCGVEIGIRRLEARPTANKCIDCKTLDEIKEKQLGA